ncbi:MAG TPA: substrate-binding domain-containing protein, partial [Candidatus Sulfotelmatobacter sp.]|nr:substrate-binding domain-containing protein [Candidatus Sulfotelmatobacter sp.]
MKNISATMVALLALWVSAAQAAEIRVLSAGAVEPALVALAEAFRNDTGHQVNITFATAPALRGKVAASEAADILIAPPAVLDDFVKAGKVLAEDRAALGRVGVGVAVRAGAPAPDISTPDALKEAVLRADSL